MKPSRSTALPADYRKQFNALFYAEQYEKALHLARQQLRRQPGHLQLLGDAATCQVRLGRMQEAYVGLRKVHAAFSQDWNTLDGLTHTAHALGKVDEARKYGRQALELRHAAVAPAPWTAPVRPAFDPDRPERNAIAFSLYGNNSLYCETAVLNALQRAKFYPAWHCRFYVDAQVPQHVCERMRGAGAQVIVVDPALQLPGTMWRFLALDDPALDFALLRDADSLISAREARAVQAWLDSPQWFHAMRDYASHTELLLAGMWGAARGALPPLLPLMQAFVQGGAHPTHADQHFLRAKVWPYVCHSVLTHDSFFGFHGAQPFPDGPPPSHGAVGDDKTGEFVAQSALPDGAQMTWGLFVRGTPEPHCLCYYTARVHKGKFSVFLPTVHLDGLKDGRLEVRQIVSA